MKSVHRIWVGCFLLILVTGCSNSQTTVEPPISPNSTDGVHFPQGTHLMGLYNITFDPVTGNAEVVPMRTAEVEVNVLKFLEPPDSPSMIILNELQFNPPEVSCKVGIQHPFPNFPEYTGFAVRGLVLTNGTMSGFDDADLVMSSPVQLRVDNADGYSRWMNPAEFPYDETIFNYSPGAMGDPAGYLYHATLNPYKLFADDLDADNDNLDLDETNKAMFSAGALNWRLYELDFGSSPYLAFQYAVVVSTENPINSPPQGPEDFPPGTVMSEPWRVDVVEQQNTLFYDNGNQGGVLELKVDVFDFENADQCTVFVEGLDAFARQEMNLTGQVGNQLTFDLDVTGIDLDDANPIQMLVAAVATDAEGYDGRLPGEELATYMLVEVVVLDEQPQDPDWPFYDDFVNYNYVWTAHGGDWWGKADGYLDASGGGDCFEEDTGSDVENFNVSWVSSPPIVVPDSPLDLVLTFNHTIEVDPVELFGHFAWDMCFVRINGEQVFPTGGPLYEDNYYPWTFDPIKCWTDYYDMTESIFNLGTQYNNTTITVEYVLDTFDFINNCDPPYFGWLIDDVLLDFDQ